MQRIAVESSNIKEIGYDSANCLLEVVFNYRNATYQYSDVPFEIYKELMNSESKGRFLANKIKGVYTYKQVPNEE